MRRRSRAGREPAKPQRRKTGARKNRIAPKAVRSRCSSDAREEIKIVRLTRERDDAFQHQRVTADKNKRLLNELRESLQQQTATSEVLQVISSSPGDLQPVFATMLEKAVRICDAKFGNLWLCEGDFLRIGATHGAPPAWSEFLRREPVVRIDPRLGTARAIAAKQPYQVADIAAEPTYGDKVRTATIELAHGRSLIGVPLLRDDEVIGLIVIYRQEVRPFTNKQIEVVQNFAAQAVIAIENARLLNELRESLEQQTATSDVLRVISSSPSDIQPVLETIGERAEKLCNAEISVVSIVDGELIRLASIHGMTEAGVEAARRVFPMRRTDETIMARAIRTRSVCHVADVLSDPQYQQKDNCSRSVRCQYAVAWVCRWSATSRSSERSLLPGDSQDYFQTHRFSFSKPLPTRR